MEDLCGWRICPPTRIGVGPPRAAASVPGAGLLSRAGLARSWRARREALRGSPGRRCDPFVTAMSPGAIRSHRDIAIDSSPFRVSFAGTFRSRQLASSVCPAADRGARSVPCRPCGLMACAATDVGGRRLHLAGKPRLIADRAGDRRVHVLREERDGRATATSAASVARRGRPETGRRLRRVFNMALTLRSRVEGRGAMATAGNAAWRAPPNCRATSSR